MEFVKVAQLGSSSGVQTLDHRQGESIGELLTRAGFEFTNYNVRVNSQPVTAEDTVPAGGVVTVVPEVKAG